MMLYLFPAIYLFTGVSFPIGVMIYWFASNLWTLAQQYILIHNNPSPNTPAFIDWQERMRAKGKDPDEIIRQRTSAMRRSARPSPAASDPTKVARQGASSPTSSPASETTPTQSKASQSQDGDGRQRIARQQPSRQTRANRKQARPRQTGDSQ